MQKHSDPVRTRELRIESARMVGASDAIFNGRRNPDAPAADVAPQVHLARCSSVRCASGRPAAKTMTAETKYQAERTRFLFDYGAR